MRTSNQQRLRVVALIDVCKAAGVLAIGVGLLKAQSHVLEDGGRSLLRFLHVSSNYLGSQRFLGLLHAADLRHGLLFGVACAYAGLRLAEAYGLWNGREWARWLGLLSAGIYVPVELYYLWHAPSWEVLSVLVLNLVVLWLLWPRRSNHAC